MTYEQALQEMEHFISHGRVLVCEIQSSEQPLTIASIAVVARSSPNVSAITKLYTKPHLEKQGYARKLMTFLCRRLVIQACSYSSCADNNHEVFFVNDPGTI